MLVDCWVKKKKQKNNSSCLIFLVCSKDILCNWSKVVLLVRQICLGRNWIERFLTKIGPTVRGEFCFPFFFLLLLSGL